MKGMQRSIKDLEEEDNAVELTVPQVILDLLPEWERENWWGIDVLIDDDGEGVFEDEKEALEEYEVESVDKINSHFLRRLYPLSLYEEEW